MLAMRLDTLIFQISFGNFLVNHTGGDKWLKSWEHEMSSNKSMRVCTQCLRSGAVTKRIHSTPFKLPAGSGKSKS